MQVLGIAELLPLILPLEILLPVDKESHSPKDLESKIGLCCQVYPQTGNEFQAEVGHRDTQNLDPAG